MRIACRAALIFAALNLTIFGTGRAQDVIPPHGPCKHQRCGIVVEWGGAGVPDHVDRRYGPLSAFPTALLTLLQAAGLQFSQDLGSANVVARVRPRLIRAACDVVEGTGSRDECITIGEVRVDFEGQGELPKAFRVSNRCGEGEYMVVSRFSQYVAEMFDFYLSVPEEKKKRPSSKC